MMCVDRGSNAQIMSVKFFLKSIFSFIRYYYLILQLPPRWQPFQLFPFRPPKPKISLCYPHNFSYIISSFLSSLSCINRKPSAGAIQNRAQKCHRVTWVGRICDFFSARTWQEGRYQLHYSTYMMLYCTCCTFCCSITNNKSQDKVRPDLRP